MLTTMTNAQITIAEIIPGDSLLIGCTAMALTFSCVVGWIDSGEKTVGERVGLPVGLLGAVVGVEDVGI